MRGAHLYLARAPGRRNPVSTVCAREPDRHTVAVEGVGLSEHVLLALGTLGLHSKQGVRSRRE